MENVLNLSMGLFELCVICAVLRFVCSGMEYLLILLVIVGCSTIAEQLCPQIALGNIIISGREIVGAMLKPREKKRREDEDVIVRLLRVSLIASIDNFMCLVGFCMICVVITRSGFIHIFFPFAFVVLSISAGHLHSPTTWGNIIDSGLDVFRTIFKHMTTSEWTAERFAQIFSEDEDEVFQRPFPHFVFPGEEKEILLDFVADLGDGLASSRAVADALVSPELRVESANNSESTNLKQAKYTIFGGDLSYPLYSKPFSLRRFVEVFEDSWDVKGDNSESSSSLNPLQRWAFFVIGNHDYLDKCVTFRELIQEDKFGNWRMGNRPYSGVFCLKIYSWCFIGMSFAPDNDLHAEEVKEIKQTIMELRTNMKKEEDDDLNFVLVGHRPFWLLDQYDPSQQKQPQLKCLQEFLRKNGHIRLYLAGDLHNYSHCKIPEEGDEDAHCVVSGGGGAFLHPVCRKASFESRYPESNSSFRWTAIFLPFLQPFVTLIVTILFYVDVGSGISTVLRRCAVVFKLPLPHVIGIWVCFYYGWHTALMRVPRDNTSECHEVRLVLVLTVLLTLVTQLLVLFRPFHTTVLLIAFVYYLHIFQNIEYLKNISERWNKHVWTRYSNFASWFYFPLLMPSLVYLFCCVAAFFRRGEFVWFADEMTALQKFWGNGCSCSCTWALFFFVVSTVLILIFMLLWCLRFNRCDRDLALSAFSGFFIWMLIFSFNCWKKVFRDKHDTLRTLVYESTSTDNDVGGINSVLVSVTWCLMNACFCLMVCGLLYAAVVNSMEWSQADQYFTDSVLCDLDEAIFSMLKISNYKNFLRMKISKCEIEIIPLLLDDVDVGEWREHKHITISATLSSRAQEQDTDSISTQNTKFDFKMQEAKWNGNTKLVPGYDGKSALDVFGTAVECVKGPVEWRLNLVDASERKVTLTRNEDNIWRYLFVTYNCGLGSSAYAPNATNWTVILPEGDILEAFDHADNVSSGSLKLKDEQSEKILTITFANKLSTSNTIKGKTKVATSPRGSKTQHFGVGGDSTCGQDKPRDKCPKAKPKSSRNSLRYLRQLLGNAMFSKNNTA